MSRQMQKLQEVQVPQQIPELIGTGKEATRISHFARLVSKTSHTVLLSGEPGVGKGLVAQLIHSLGRADKPFVIIECGAMSEELLNSELFGHKMGAFTDAKTQKSGLFEIAADGTVFLDEVENMTHAMQVRLLHVLQEKSFRQVGATATVPFNARVIAATNTSLKEAIQEGKLRKDLYDRLNHLSLSVAPLRNRKEDVPTLANYFLSRAEGGLEKVFSPSALLAMNEYHWPGNVRELSVAVERGVVFSAGNEITAEDLQLDGEFTFSEESRKQEGVEISSKIFKEVTDRVPTFSEVHKEYLRILLVRAEGSVKKVSMMSGLDQATVYRHVDKFGLDQFQKSFKKGSS